MNSKNRLVTFLRRERLARAFTLIELLVVIGIIAVLVGVLVGVLGGGGNSSTALQSAQSTMSSLLSSARGQAALTGYNAAVFINKTKTAGNVRYLHYCLVAVYKPIKTGSQTYAWTPVNDGYYFPNGIYVVPNPVPAGSDVRDNVNFSSINTAGFDGVVTNLALNSSALDDWFVIGINPLGQRVDATAITASNQASAPVSTATGNVVLSVAEFQPPGAAVPVIFTNSSNVRGFFISRYGVSGFINDATGFGAN